MTRSEWSSEMHVSTIVRRIGRLLVSGGPDGSPRAGGAWVLTTVTLLAMLTTFSVRTGDATLLSFSDAVVVVLVWTPLVVRGWWPVAALLGTVVTESTYLAVFVHGDGFPAGEAFGAYQPVPIASAVAAFTVASRFPPRVGWSAGGATALTLLCTGILTHGTALVLTDLVTANVVLLSTAAGVMVSSRRERSRQIAARLVEETAQAVLDERLRIARELHDALAHNLALVNAQAGVAAYLLEENPAAASAALRDITVHTRRAIDELGATVGLLRYAEDAAPEPGATMSDLRPVPGLGDLDRLVASVRSTGTKVELRVDGTPAELDQQADLAAYRIVQEALTNATKHAPSQPAMVHLHWSESDLRIEVTNSISEVRGDNAPGTGHGVIGMRERAAAAGGWLNAERTFDGQFIVCAMLPTHTPRGTIPLPRGTTSVTQEEDAS